MDFMHKEIRYEIKDGKIYTYKIEEISDYSKLLRYKPNYRKITDDIIFVDKGKHKDYLLLSQELFAEEIKHSPKPTTNGVLGNHSIFFYMYGHTKDWIKATENDIAIDKALLICCTDSNIKKTLLMHRNSRNINEYVQKLETEYKISQTVSRHIANLSRAQLAGIILEQLEATIEKERQLLEKLHALLQLEQN